MLDSRWCSVCYDQHQPWYSNSKHACSNCSVYNNCPCNNCPTNCHRTVIDDIYYYSSSFFEYELRHRRLTIAKQCCFAKQDIFALDCYIAWVGCREFIGILRTSDNRAYFTILIQNPHFRFPFYSLLMNTRSIHFFRTMSGL